MQKITIHSLLLASVFTLIACSPNESADVESTDTVSDNSVEAGQENTTEAADPVESVQARVTEITAKAKEDAKAAMSKISVTSKDSYAAAKEEVAEIQAAASEKINAVYNAAADDLKAAGKDVGELKDKAMASLKSLFE